MDIIVQTFVCTVIGVIFMIGMIVLRTREASIKKIIIITAITVQTMGSDFCDSMVRVRIFGIKKITLSPFRQMIKEQYKYSELTAKIIGCAMEVHKALGNGFQEVIYQRALAHEMELQGLNFVREFEMEVFYKTVQVGTRRVDFLVEGYLSVELKALIQLEPVHWAQAMNYLEAYNLEVGLLLNFGNTKLEFKRFENKKYRAV